MNVGMRGVCRRLSCTFQIYTDRHYWTTPEAGGECGQW